MQRTKFLLEENNKVEAEKSIIVTALTRTELRKFNEKSRKNVKSKTKENTQTNEILNQEKNTLDNQKHKSIKSYKRKEHPTEISISAKKSKKALKTHNINAVVEAGNMEVVASTRSLSNLSDEETISQYAEADIETRDENAVPEIHQDTVQVSADDVEQISFEEKISISEDNHDAVQVSADDVEQISFEEEISISEDNHDAVQVNAESADDVEQISFEEEISISEDNHNAAQVDAEEILLVDEISTSENNHIVAQVFSPDDYTIADFLSEEALRTQQHFNFFGSTQLVAQSNENNQPAARQPQIPSQLNQDRLRQQAIQPQPRQQQAIQQAQPRQQAIQQAQPRQQAIQAQPRLQQSNHLQSIQIDRVYTRESQTFFNRANSNLYNNRYLHTDYQRLGDIMFNENEGENTNGYQSLGDIMFNEKENTNGRRR